MAAAAARGAAPPSPAAAALAAVVVAVLLSPVLAASADDDAAILHRMREAVWAADPGWTADMRGWRRQDQAKMDVCSWAGVKCNAQRRITAITLDTTADSHKRVVVPPDMAPNGSMPLLPELARLEFLDILSLARLSGAPVPSIPTEWLEPGAFPRLTGLVLSASSNAAQRTQLPNIPPGAFPHLQRLELAFRGMQSMLPPSWGSPAVLPSLLELIIRMPLEGSLPAEWAQGFQRLDGLHLMGVPVDMTIERPEGARAEDIQLWRAAKQTSQRGSSSGSGDDAVQGLTASGTNQLPAEWSAGFPKLEVLQLVNLGLTGSLPRSWQDGGFPSLNGLDLSFNYLTGTLPPQLFSSHEQLSTVWLDGNRFTGTLPAEWGAVTSDCSLFLEDNLLSGPAFPPAWLQPGAMPGLLSLSLAGNQALHGTLPANLSWPDLRLLWLAGTGVTGAVPDAWCSAPFRKTLKFLELNHEPLHAILPACAADALLQLQHRTKYLTGKEYAALARARAKSSSSHHAAVSARAAALALAALAAACLAVRKLLQRTLRQRTHEHHMGRMVGAVALAGPLAQHLGSYGAHASSAAPREHAVPALTDSRLQRINSLLRSAISSSDSSLSTLCLNNPPAFLPQQLGWQNGGYTGSLTAVHQQGLSCSALTDPSVAEQADGCAGSAGECRQTCDSLGLPAASWPQHLGTSSLQLTTPEEVEFITDAAGELVLLGVGGCAACYLGKLQGGLVAVKVYELEACMGWQAVWHEVVIMRQCVHERIVPLYAVAVKNNLLVLAMKLMLGGTLFRALRCPRTRQRLRWEAGGRQVAVDVAEGLDFLHTDMSVLHGDLKPSNVLLTKGLRACIGDLGTARVLAGTARTASMYTCSHAAPEQLLGARCTHAADMYSFGLLLVELVTQTLVGARGSHRLPHAPDECSEAVLALIDGCLSLDPTHRPTAAEALQCLHTDALSSPSTLGPITSVCVSSSSEQSELQPLTHGQQHCSVAMGGMQ